MRSIARKDARTVRTRSASARFVFTKFKDLINSFSRTSKKMRNGTVVDEPMETYGHFASSIAMTTKAVKINVQLITSSDKPIVLVK